MAFRPWQVGLAIENGALRALALQRRRHGWQLRHWWQYALPGEPPTDEAGPPAGLAQVLSAWRRQLPGGISLRVCLPAHLVTQRRMAAPDRRLCEPERGWFIAAHARRHFPCGSENLMLDYRRDPHRPDTLVVTAARQKIVAQWLSCLSEAGLTPQVLDILPCALRYMACEAGLARDRLLVHASPRGWFWVSPPAHALESGFIAADEAPDFPTVRQLIAGRCPGIDETQTALYFSSETRLAPPDHTLAWSPFAALWQAHPPMPAWPAAFVFAGGLAVRRGDA
ncbi:pilus assembly protein HofM [Sodalis sp. RH21]|uniref:pilus assembly protein HofM n=1 Tax=unclassified Sodalis (in: enterobacteria) TaxID=2636512 RepID=UPI0039B43952